jgi:putative transposase
MVFHVVSRGVERMRLFLKDADFEAFQRIIEKTLQTRPMRICAYCLMSNHWHS